MTSTFPLLGSSAGLLVIDVQEKLFPKVDSAPELQKNLIVVVKAFQQLGLPIVVSEQYPQGLGASIEPLKETLGNE